MSDAETRGVSSGDGARWRKPSEISCSRPHSKTARAACSDKLPWIASLAMIYAAGKLRMIFAEGLDQRYDLRWVQSAVKRSRSGRALETPQTVRPAGSGFLEASPILTRSRT